MIAFKTLEQTSFKDIFNCFREAFTPYFVPMDQRFEIHHERWVANGVDLSLSLGAFDGDKLVGFILHVPEKNFIFNIATGVLKEYRGMKMVDQMYHFGFPLMKPYGEARLEVICDNIPAIKSYERSGFVIKRKLLCFKGEVPHFFIDPLPHTIYTCSELSFSKEMRTLQNHAHSTEQDERALLKQPNLYLLHQLRDHGQLITYAITSKKSGGFIQFEGSEEAGTSLLVKMNVSGQNFKMNNIDENKQDLINFFIKLGFENYISQYEMVKKLS